MTKPGCVQHDCDKCKNLNYLLSGLHNALNTYGYTKKQRLKWIAKLMKEYKAHIKQAQQS